MQQNYEAKLQRQIDLEQHYLARSREAFYRQFKKLAAAGNGNRTKIGRDMIATLIEKVEEAIEKELASRISGAPTTSTAAVAALSVETAALIAIQNLVCGAMAGDTRVSRALITGTEVEYEVNARKLQEYSTGAYKALQRRLQTSCPTEASKVSLRNAFFKKWYNDQITPTELNKRDKLKSGMFLLGLAEQCAEGWITRTRHKDRRRKHTKLVYQFTPEFAETLSKHTELLSLAKPQFPPLLLQPNDWTGVLSGGPYYTQEMNRRTRFIRSKSWDYLRDMEARSQSADPAKNFHMQFAPVNKAQKTAWRVNTDILNTLRMCMEKGGGEKWALPIIDPSQLPTIKDKIPGSKEFKKAQKARSEMQSKSLTLRGTIAAAAEFEQEEELYFAMAIDSRGRGYYTYGGNYLNTQGNDVSRALLNFANGEKLGRRDAADWLYYATATHYGQDKGSRAERVRWVEDNLDIILACANDPYESDHRKFWTIAKKPWQFLACCFEVAGFIVNGYDHITRIPIQLDGCQNALQHTAAMMQDEELAVKCGVLPNPGGLPDLYEDVAEVAMNHIREMAKVSYNHPKFGNWTEAQLEELAHEYWLKLKDKERSDEKKWSAHLRDIDDILFPRILMNHPSIISRDMCKRPVMTFIYDSRSFSRKDYISDAILEQQQADPEHPVTDEQRWRLTTYLEPIIRNGTETLLSGALDYLAWLKAVARAVSTRPDSHTPCKDCGANLCKCECEVSKNEKARRKLSCNCHRGQLGVTWVTPLGFPVVHKPVRIAQRQVCTTVGSITYTLSYASVSATLDREKLLSGIAANFTHSYDAAMLWDVVNECGDDIPGIALIHDSFGTLATKTSLLRHILKRCFVRLYQGRDHLASFAVCNEYQIQKDGRTVKMPPLPTRGNLNIEQAIESEYLFS